MFQPSRFGCNLHFAPRPPLLVSVGSHQRSLPATWLQIRTMASPPFPSLQLDFASTGRRLPSKTKVDSCAVSRRNKCRRVYQCIGPGLLSSAMHSPSLQVCLVTDLAGAGSAASSLSSMDPRQLKSPHRDACWWARAHWPQYEWDTPEENISIAQQPPGLWSGNDTGVSFRY
ncbi:hypothetical protein NM208_g13376 [Fusarium decemcellulare]|uniref:Uncharacterized protein n=1 Tax=Fusarium decemcellulare TaxID=57161 RepID=A0ACC1RK05_9HYPO|nr:hypothetical protein NM208_g13376 [Fusarium decemcellulare]